VNAKSSESEKMQAISHCCVPPVSIHSVFGLAGPVKATDPQGEVMRALRVVDGLVSASQVGWGRGMRIDERSGAPQAAR
jgi:hypothetical protein